MIQTADVNKLACEYIRLVESYLVSQKYAINPCADEAQGIYLTYKQATSLASCLEHEDECLINDVANNLPSYVACVGKVTNCNEQATIAITQKPVSCTASVGLRKTNGIVSAFPDVVLHNDSLYHPAVIDVYYKTCQDDNQIEVSSGCQALSGSGYSCNDIFKFSQNIFFNIEGPQHHSSGYIKTLRIYETDVNGVLNPAPIDLDLSPSNLPAWISCLGCSGITASHLYFGHPNWTNAFLTLLNNVTYTLYGSLVSAWKQPGKHAYFISLKETVKHNPAGNWIGINVNDFYMEWVTDSNTTIAINSPSSTGYSQTTHSMGKDLILPTVCGNITTSVILNSALTKTNLPAINFNYLELTTTEVTKAATLQNTVLPSCSLITLTGVVTTSQTIEYVKWTNAEDFNLSNDYTLTISKPGMYFFKVALSNGCLITKSITI